MQHETIADFIKTLQEHCDTPDATRLLITIGGTQLKISEIVAYPGATVVVLAPRS